MQIEKMTAKTTLGVAEIEAECFHDPWDEKTLNNTLSNDSITYLVAIKDAGIAGYVGYYDLIDEFSVINIAVKKEYRSHGIGTALLNRMKENANELSKEKITLEVRASNIPAIKLYEKCGYVKTAEKENYYTKPKEAAYFYQLETDTKC